MGVLEEDARIRAKRERIQDIALRTLYGVALVGTVVVAPNAARLLGHIEMDLTKKRKPQYRINQALQRLSAKGMIRKDSHGRLHLTPAGVKKARALFEIQRHMSKKRPRWDNRWRVVIFDVWERRRQTRDRLRSILKRVGFVRIQDSVWAYPYDSEELLVFLRTELRLGKGILYIIAEGMEGDERLRKHFRLN